MAGVIEDEDGLITFVTDRDDTGKSSQHTAQNAENIPKPKAPAPVSGWRRHAIGFAWGLGAAFVGSLGYFGIQIATTAGFSVASLPSIAAGIALTGAAMVVAKINDRKFQGWLSGTKHPTKTIIAGIVAGTALVFGLNAAVQNTAAKITFPQPGAPAPVSELAPLSPQFAQAGIRAPAGFTFASPVSAPKLG